MFSAGYLAGGAEAEPTRADQSDYFATEYQDNYRDSFYYASDAAEFEEIVAAIAAGTSTLKPIKMAPGTFQLTQCWSVAKEELSGLWVIGSPEGGTILRGPSDDEAVEIVFAASELNSTFEIGFKDLRIHSQTDENAMHINNTNAGKKINVYFDGSCCDSSGTGKALLTTHGDTSNAIRMYCNPGFNTDWDKSIYLAGGNNGDRFRATGHNFEEDGIETSNTATLMEITLAACLLKHEGITGGNAAQKVNLVGCWTESGGAAAAADASDVGGDQTTVVSP